MKQTKDILEQLRDIKSRAIDSTAAQNLIWDRFRALGEIVLKLEAHTPVENRSFVLRHSAVEMVSLIETQLRIYYAVLLTPPRHTSEILRDLKTYNSLLNRFMT